MTSSSITVQWGAVNCIHHNGDITGYSVRYGVQGSDEGDRTVEMSSGDSRGGMYQISGLSAATVYTIEVAAVNSAGTGVFSNALIAETPDSKYTIQSCFVNHGLCAHLQVLWNEVFLIFLKLKVCTSL